MKKVSLPKQTSNDALGFLRHKLNAYKKKNPSKGCKAIDGLVRYQIGIILKSCTSALLLSASSNTTNVNDF
jgi:hypothetical protein